MARTTSFVRAPAFFLRRYADYVLDSRMKMVPFYIFTNWINKRVAPQLEGPNFKKDLKNLLKYFPKRLRDIKKVTAAYINRPMDHAEKILYKRIMSKYNKNLFRHLCLTADENIYPPSSLTRKYLEKLNFIYIYDHSYGAPSNYPYKHLRHILKQNKFLKSFLSDTHNRNLSVPIEYFKPLKALKTLEISKTPQEPSHTWKRSLANIQILTLFGLVKPDLLHSLSKLQHLRKFQFQGSIEESSHFDDLPFNQFRNNRTHFDIRLCSLPKLTSFDKIEKGCLTHTEFLGISAEYCPFHEKRYDPFHLESLRLQRQSKTLLCLNFQSVDKKNIPLLFMNCPNLKTLDLILSSKVKNQIDLEGIEHFENLLNLVLQFHFYKSFPQSLFKNLISYVQAHQSLSCVSFSFSDGKINQGYKKILPFFEACQNSLTKLSLRFQDIEIENDGGIYLYQGITQLKALTSLCLTFGFNKNDFETHVKGLSTALSAISGQLEELYLSFNGEIKFLESSLQQATRLKKFTLELMDKASTELHLLKILTHLVNLKDLEIILHADLWKQNWTEIKKAINELPNLELVKVGTSLDIKFNFSRDEIQSVAQNHPNLKLLAFGNFAKYGHKQFIGFIITIKKSYNYDIDDFLKRSNTEVLENVKKVTLYID